MVLETCTTLWGSAEIHEVDPKVDVVRNGFYLPYVHGGAWGLFENDGRPVTAAVDFRQGNLLASEQTLATSVKGVNIDQMAPGGAYVYGGRINPHFGHFLVNTLPRFWAMARVRSPSTKILCHGPGTPEGWFGVPFIAAAFRLLGLSPNDFAVFEHPVRLASVVVPGTSLEEQHAGYTAYRTMCQAMGERVWSDSSNVPDGRPVYYSKARLTSAVGVITNETEIEAVMKTAGVRIVYPEALNLAEQIRVMSSAERIYGTAGSFLHASIFCPSRHITCLNVTEAINSNYTIIDTLAKNAASYYFPPGMQVLEKQQNFITSRYVPDAAAVARALLDAT